VEYKYTELLPQSQTTMQHSITVLTTARDRLKINEHTIHLWKRIFDTATTQDFTFDKVIGFFLDNVNNEEKAAKFMRLIIMVIRFYEFRMDKYISLYDYTLHQGPKFLSNTTHNSFLTSLVVELSNYAISIVGLIDYEKEYDKYIEYCEHEPSGFYCNDVLDGILFILQFSTKTVSNQIIISYLCDYCTGIVERLNDYRTIYQNNLNVDVNSILSYSDLCAKFNGGKYI
jgi:hypothetical protein